MITDVESGHERGQSVVEFLISLPLMLGLVVLLVRVNTAIQISIVNQQYVRAQAIFLTYNSPVYPELRLRSGAMHEEGFNQMLIGMSETAPPSSESGREFYADAPVFSISRNKVATDDESQQEPDRRSKIRVRTTVTLCTQTEVVPVSGGKPKPVLDTGNILSEQYKPGASYCMSPDDAYI